MAVELYNVEKLLGLRPEHLPRHIAIIMDGNGRWAQSHGLARNEGHRRGVEVVSEIVTESAKLGVEYLTLYSFSMENWRRPRAEVEILMHLCAEYLVLERPKLMDNNIRLVHVGRQEDLPEQVVQKLRETVELTANNTGMTLALALNYSARTEIVDATKRIAEKVSKAELAVDQICEEVISEHLYTAGIPDPDLLIRTAGERRLSNFLLWQLSYTELYVSKVFWPDFKPADLRRAIKDYAGRERRFGRVGHATVLAAQGG